MPSGEEHEIEPNETILNLSKRVGLHIQSVCKGLPSCAECRVQIIEGEHHVLPPSSKEVSLIGTAHYVDRSRLACQLRCFGDVTVDLAQQIAKEQRAKEKPRDRMARGDGQESKAVLGGILDHVVAEDAEMPEPENDQAIPLEKVQVDAFKGDPNLDKRDSFYGDFYTGKKQGKQNKSRSGGKGKRNNPNPNSKNAKASGNAKASNNAKAEDNKGDKPKRKRRRRTNNNRGPGKPAAGNNNQS